MSIYSKGILRFRNQQDKALPQALKAVLPQMVTSRDLFHHVVKQRWSQTRGLMLIYSNSIQSQMLLCWPGLMVSFHIVTYILGRYTLTVGQL